MDDAVKTWTVVQFLETDTNSVEAVPSSWIVGDDCLWPSVTGQQLQKAIKNQQSPQDNWMSYKISNFKRSTSANYAIARLKASKALNCSDLSSDENVVRKKRKIIRKNYSSSEEETETSTLPIPPSLKKEARNCRSAADDGPSIFQKFNFPLQNDGDLKEFEQYLEDANDFAKAVDELSRIGGANAYDFTKRTMSKLLSNKLACEFSWLGLKKNKSLENYELAN
ncbi:hypothetical protein FQR65_LT16127 [Abscondita terminalis]|nr:hypothetical protein FQR65_LT16127 [Abscondita terminalis]